MHAYRFLPVLAALLIAALPLLSAAGPRLPQTESEARVVVRLKPGSALDQDQALTLTQSAATVAAVGQRRADRLAAGAGVPLRAGRALGLRSQVLHAQGIDSATLARRLAADPNVESVAIDRRMRALRVPNDPLYADNPARSPGPVSGQWYLRAPTAELKSAVNAEAAWDRTRGDAAIVVAVLDTGIFASHLDFAASGHILPGYDLISDKVTANDGNGRDNDASDPGDWITAADAAGSAFSGCTVEASSWHGTGTAALIGALSDNGLGMAGIASASRILPVRVLGKCGGFESDIAAGMLWAAGIDQPGLPGSVTPARVINMSLGGSGACGTIYQPAVDALAARNVVIVASAGNTAGLAVGAPANCAGVIAVAGLRHAGSKVGYSDLGPEIAISAPGGNCVNIGAGQPCLYPILTASNSGTQGPQAGGSIWSDDRLRVSVGTSFASPIVAGTAALMLAVQPQLTAAEVRSGLQSSARAFPSSGAGLAADGISPVPVCHAPTSLEQDQCYCVTGLCGAGMLDAAGAVAAAAGSHARIGLSSTPLAGQTLLLDSAGSLLAAGHSAIRWAWVLVDGGGIVSGFAGASNAASASLLPTAAGTVVVRLTLTDDLGMSSTVDRSIVVTDPPETPPASGGGGGGAFSGAWLLGLMLAVAALAFERRRRA